jgi:hypothetical protein
MRLERQTGVKEPSRVSTSRVAKIRLILVRPYAQLRDLEEATFGPYRTTYADLNQSGCARGNT